MLEITLLKLILTVVRYAVRVLIYFLSASTTEIYFCNRAWFWLYRSIATDFIVPLLLAPRWEGSCLYYGWGGRRGLYGKGNTIQPLSGTGVRTPPHPPTPPPPLGSMWCRPHCSWSGIGCRWGIIPSVHQRPWGALMSGSLRLPLLILTLNPPWHCALC